MSLLIQATNKQKDMFDGLDEILNDAAKIDNPTPIALPTHNQSMHKIMTISRLTYLYIKEMSVTKSWGPKNESDIKFVLGHLANWFDDCDINELDREDFNDFKINVLHNLPKSSQNKIFKGKTTKELIKITIKYKIKTIGLTTINKHFRRVHQVFQWADDTGKITKNLTKNLQTKNKKN